VLEGGGGGGAKSVGGARLQLCGVRGLQLRKACVAALLLGGQRGAGLLGLLSLSKTGSGKAGFLGWFVSESRCCQSAEAERRDRFAHHAPQLRRLRSHALVCLGGSVVTRWRWREAGQKQHDRHEHHHRRCTRYTSELPTTAD
jgi:hypothetical protein